MLTQADGRLAFSLTNARLPPSEFDEPLITEASRSESDREPLVWGREFTSGSELEAEGERRRQLSGG